MSEINIDSVDLNLIRLFVAVYEEKSATRAGLRLDQTQSAVSFSLTKLRHLYNDPLFVRTGRGLSPTLFADQLYPALKESLERFSSAFTGMIVNDDFWAKMVVKNSTTAEQ